MASAAAVASVPGSLSSPLELTVKCKSLPSLDVLSKSDPMCVFYIKEGGRYVERGRSEWKKNDENPVFAKRFVIDYKFEEVQYVKFEIYDVDSDSPNLAKQDYIGYYECTVAQIVTRPGRKVSAPLKDKHNHDLKYGTITIYGEELKGNNTFLTLALCGIKLDKKDFFGKSDPYLTFHKCRSDGSYQEVYRTEVVKNTLDPVWKEFTLPLQTLCNNDVHRPIVIKCFDWDSDNSSEYIGEFSTTVAKLAPQSFQSTPPGTTPSTGSSHIHEYKLTKPEHKTPEKRLKIHGTIVVKKAMVRIEPSFLDYVRGGMQINLLVAIDYTGSNGDPRDKQSLHYRGGREPNAYQRAIQTIGEIVAPYDADGNIAAFGFGAVLHGNRETTHAFHINMNPSNPEVHGLSGLMAAYDASFNHLTLSGPTHFAPIIHLADQVARRPFTATFQHYSILLIITDGAINDMDETIAAVVSASNKPLSIIIIGVGDADFSAMKFLDADEKKLSAFGQTQARDNVQFVALRDFANRPISELAAATLAELPGQVTGFMKLFNIPPLPPMMAAPSMSNLHISKGPAPSPSAPSLSHEMSPPPPYTG